MVEFQGKRCEAKRQRRHLQGLALVSIVAKHLNFMGEQINAIEYDFATHINFSSEKTLNTHVLDRYAGFR